jgi:hypothetical protein
MAGAGPGALRAALSGVRTWGGVGLGLPSELTEQDNATSFRLRGQESGQIGRQNDSRGTKLEPRPTYRH